LRLIDVEAALSARTYFDGPPVKISVTDSLIAANSATFEVGPDRVRRTAASADLQVDISGLGAAYWAGAPLRSCLSPVTPPRTPRARWPLVTACSEPAGRPTPEPSPDAQLI
jgi:hypothetical protein